MKRNSYGKIIVDCCMFINKLNDGDFVFLLLYVDDMFTIGKDNKKMQILKK